MLRADVGAKPRNGGIHSLVKQAPDGMPPERRASLPHFIPPQLSALTARAQRGRLGPPGQADGYRMQLRVEGRMATILTRNGLDCSPFRSNFCRQHSAEAVGSLSDCKRETPLVARRVRVSWPASARLAFPGLVAAVPNKNSASSGQRVNCAVLATEPHHLLFSNERWRGCNGFSCNTSEMGQRVPRSD